VYQEGVGAGIPIRFAGELAVKGLLDLILIQLGWGDLG